MAGEEILVADGAADDRIGLTALAEQAGLVASAVENAALGRERITGKFFAVALIDLDLPGGGVELIEFTRAHSPATQCIALTSRKNFDAAVLAFRAGCIDVTFKRPDEMPRLESAIATALARYRSSQQSDVRDAERLLDEMMKTLVTLGRQLYAQEIDSLTETSRVQLNVLFVDDDTRFLKEVSEQVANLPMDAFVEMSGGGALDKIGAHSFDLVIAKETLSDLPGSIAVNAAQQRTPACVGLLYGVPGQSGRIDRVQEGRIVDSYAPFQSAKHLADRVRQLVEEEHARRRERKVLHVIGSKHGELLRRYGEVKRQLERLAPTSQY